MCKEADKVLFRCEVKDCNKGEGCPHREDHEDLGNCHNCWCPGIGRDVVCLPVDQPENMDRVELAGKTNGFVLKKCMEKAMRDRGHGCPECGSDISVEIYEAGFTIFHKVWMSLHGNKGISIGGNDGPTG